MVHIPFTYLLVKKTTLLQCVVGVTLICVFSYIHRKQMKNNFQNILLALFMIVLMTCMIVNTVSLLRISHAIENIYIHAPDANPQ